MKSIMESQRKTQTVVSTIQEGLSRKEAEEPLSL